MIGSKREKTELRVRETNYDLLRIFACLEVIAIHVSAYYFVALTDGDAAGNYHTDSMLTILLYRTLSCFAVASFFMLSGAFLLSDDRNADFRYFYKKSFKNVFVHVIIVSLLFYVYSQSKAVFSLINGSTVSLLEPIKALVKGAPYYHLWYVYALIGVYVLVPILILVKNKTGEKAFEKLSWIALAVCTISGFTSEFKLEWSISSAVCYLGFVMAGYQLRRHCINKKNNFQAVLLIALGFLSQLIITYVQYQHTLQGISHYDEKFKILGTFNPVVVFSAVIMFAGFSKLELKSLNLKNLAGHTFNIYLLHPFVLDFIKKYVQKICGGLPKAEYFIPLCIAAVFLLSYLLSLIYKFLWKKFDGKTHLTDKILKKF